MNNKQSLNTDDLLLTSLNEADMVLCIKDVNKQVLQQNIACKTLCGDREGETCLIGCMEIFAQDNNQQWNSWGNRTYPNSYLHDGYYDVTILSSEQHLTTILQPLAQKQAQAVEYYKNIGLSKRELQVITEVIKGSSNNDICQRLSISNATLRTHLNKVYAKVTDTGDSISHLPKERYSAGCLHKR